MIGKLRATVLALLALAPGPVRGETILGQRLFVEFASEPSSPEWAAAERWGAKYFAKATAAGHPIIPRVARTNSTVLISLESVAICDRAKGCPLLVFRDVAKAPVLETTSFQNLILDYRDKGTYLIIRVWDATRECLISGGGRARCKDVAAKK